MNFLKKNYKDVFVNSIIAVIVGVLIGVLDVIFGRTLLFLTEFRSMHMVWLVPFLPASGLLIVFLYRKLNEESMKGMTLIFQTGHKERDHIPKMLIPLVIVTTWVTHLFGGSAGREGVAVQLGAAVSYNFGKIFKRTDHSRVLLIVGMAAGFGGLFQTPLAAAFFSLEVLVVGVFRHDALLPALIAAFTASQTSHLLGLEKFSVSIADTLTWNFDTIWKIVVISIVFGVVGGLFAHLLKKSKIFFSKHIINPYVKIFMIGIVIAGLMLLLHGGRYTGLGTNLIASSFFGGEVFAYDWVLKIVFTVLTLAAGFQGGEVTPLFAIGATLGILLASLTGLPLLLVAALGYAAVFGSATNTLFAPILIGAEVFGPQYILHFGIVCSIAYVFNGNQSIYSGQLFYNFRNKAGDDNF